MRKHASIMGKLFGLLSMYGLYHAGKGIAGGAEDVSRGKYSQGLKRMAGGTGMAALDASLFGSGTLVGMGLKGLKVAKPLNYLQKAKNYAIGAGSTVGDVGAAMLAGSAMSAGEKGPAVARNLKTNQVQLRPYSHMQQATPAVTPNIVT